MVTAATLAYPASSQRKSIPQTALVRTGRRREQAGGRQTERPATKAASRARTHVGSCDAPARGGTMKWSIGWLRSPGTGDVSMSEFLEASACKGRRPDRVAIRRLVPRPDPHRAAAPGTSRRALPRRPRRLRQDHPGLRVRRHRLFVRACVLGERAQPLLPARPRPRHHRHAPVQPGPPLPSSWCSRTCRVWTAPAPSGSPA